MPSCLRALRLFLQCSPRYLKPRLASLFILGIRVEYVARGAAVLLCVFGTAMTLSGLIESQFFYAVFVLAAGAWVVSMADATWVSLDSLLWCRRPQTA